MERHIKPARPGTVPKGPIDLIRLRAAAKARVAGRPVHNGHAVAMVRARQHAIARGKPSAAPPVRRGSSTG